MSARLPAPLAPEDYPVSIQLDVSWGQQDALGHVNNIIYFRWFEDVRMELFRRIGMMRWMEEHQQGPILAHTECLFRQAVTWPDRVRVATSVLELREDRFSMEYAIFSERLGLCTQGRGRIVYFDYQLQQKTPLPAALHRALAELQRDSR